MARWIDDLAARLAATPAFAGCALRPARGRDEPLLYALYREAMREYVAATWGWDEGWQRAHFLRAFAPPDHALIVRSGVSASALERNGEAVIGRISLRRHWRRLVLRDIELVAPERNRGLGTALVAAVLELGRAERRSVELVVLKCNPAQRLYARLGFQVIADDGARLTMRA